MNDRTQLDVRFMLDSPYKVSRDLICSKQAAFMRLPNYLLRVLAMLSLSVVISYPAKEASLKKIARFSSTRANDDLSLANQPFRKSHHFLYVRALRLCVMKQSFGLIACSHFSSVSKFNVLLIHLQVTLTFKSTLIRTFSKTGSATPQKYNKQNHCFKPSDWFAISG